MKSPGAPSHRRERDFWAASAKGLLLEEAASGDPAFRRFRWSCAKPTLKRTTSGDVTWLERDVKTRRAKGFASALRWDARPPLRL